MKHIDKFSIFESRDVTKINFEWNGFKFRNISIKDGQYGVYVPIGAVSQVVRQYIKQKYAAPFQIASQSYAGGDSIRVYFSPLDVSKKDYDEMNNHLSSLFSAGSFDGMEDIYNYDNDKEMISYTYNDNVVTFGTKYFFAEYRPKYGTVAYNKWEESE
jgi:hypothetical protein